MNKKELVVGMRAFVGGGDFISSPEIAKWLRVSRDKVPDLLEGVTAFGNQRKRYFIPEVAERVIERRP